MAKLYNRVKMTVSNTPGTGTVTLNAASTGHQSFAEAGVSNGDVVSYVIEDGNAWEYGLGTYTSSGTTLARTTVQKSFDGTSTYGTSAISLTSSATVAIVPLAIDFSGATGGGSDQAFWCNDTTINYDYTIPTGKNAGTFGPATIAEGKTVTVGSGSVWTIV